MKASHAKVASLPTRDDDVAPGSSVRSEGAEEMSGDKIAARTERTTRKPRMGHAMATAGRGPRLLRRGGLLSVCRPVAPNWLLCCVAPQHFLRCLGMETKRCGMSIYWTNKDIFLVQNKYSQCKLHSCRTLI